MKNLPDTILANIIHFLDIPLVYLRDFKPLLPLVQVNQRWRQAVQKIVYNTLWLEYWGDSMLNEEKPKKKKRRRHWSKRKKGFSWQTNLPLLHSPPRTLRIQSLDFDHEFLYFHQLLPHLHNLPLRSVRELEIPSHTWSNNLNRQLPTEISQQQAQIADGLVQYLLQAMPDIQTISTPRGLNHSLAASHLTHRLVLRYWPQLRSLDGPQLALPLPTTNTQMSLTHLNVHSDSLVDFPLSGCPQLRSLTLNGLQPFFSWSHMFRGLEFPRLHSLSLRFASDRAVTDSHWSDSLRPGKHSRSVTMGISAQPIEFPQLHTLLVANVPYTYSQAWAMFVKAEPLRHLHVSGPFGHIKYLDPRMLASLDAIHVDVYTSQNSPVRMYPFLQQLFAEPAHSLGKFSLSHPSPLLPLPLPAFPPESIAGWSSLHTLVLSTYVPAVALVSLLCQLPRLYRLVADTIANNKDQSIAARKASHRFHIDANELLTPSEFPPPASFSIRHLQLHTVGYLYQKPTLQAILYILLSCPQTNQLMVRAKYHPPIQDFLQLHQALYPQLVQNLVFIQRKQGWPDAGDAAIAQAS